MLTVPFYPWPVERLRKPTGLLRSDLERTLTGNQGLLLSWWGWFHTAPDRKVSAGFCRGNSIKSEKTPGAPLLRWELL